MATEAVRRNLWQAAADTLSAEEQHNLTNPTNECKNILEELLETVRRKQRLSFEKRWKYTKKDGRQVVIRDLLERASKWVQRFKEVGDVAIQYDPAHAALPWAAVRLVLQISINDVEIFGAVAEGVEIVARLISRTACYEAVYLGDHTEAQDISRSMLEQELISLYSAILVYLSRAAKYYGFDTAKRVLGSVVNSTAGTREQLQIVLTREEKVEKAVQLLQGDMVTSIGSKIHAMETMHSEQHLATQRLLNLLEKPLLRNVEELERFQARIKAEERREIAQWLSTINHRNDHERAHRDFLEGTGRWFIQRQEYRDWQNLSSSSMLWVNGIPGCGKTKLLSLAVQQYLNAAGNDTSLAPVAYFYCSKVNSRAARKSNAVLCSLLKQIAFRWETDQIHSSVYEEFVRRKAEADKDGVDLLSPNAEECLRMLLAVLHDCPATILIDGLDELGGDNTRLLSALKDITDQSPNIVKILLSSRDEPTIATHLQGIPAIHISPLDNSGDISYFIQANVDAAISERRLLQGKVSAQLREHITATLIGSAASMFLWASLHIQQLCDAQKYKLEKDVVNALKSCPSTLQSTLGDMYRRVEEYPQAAKETARNIFMWLLAAERPLLKTELIVAISRNSDGAYSAVSEQEVFDICSGFIAFERSTGYVSLAHASIQEYLESKPEYQRSHINATLALRCLNVLLNGFDASNSETMNGNSSDEASFHSYAVKYWGRHYAKVSDNDTTEELDQALSAFILEDQGQNFEIWIEDVQALINQDQVLESSLHAELSACMPQDLSPVFVASVYGLLDLIEKMPRQGVGCYWDMTNKLGASPLYVGSRDGRLNVVDKLIQLGANVNAPGGYFGNAIQAAAFQGHYPIVQSLLEVGADPKLSGKYDSAMHVALVGGQQSIAKLLLSWMPEESAAETELWLTLAANYGLYDVSEVLLERMKPDWNLESVQPDYPHNALQAALYRGRARVAMRMVEKLPDVNLMGGHFGNALQAASMGGNLVLTSKLLDMGADANALGRFGSPLKAACFSGHEGTVQLLIARGAVIGPRDSNALVAAAGGGYTSIVKLLIETYRAQLHEKTDPWSKESLLGQALEAACRSGHCDIVAHLLDNGADTFATGALEAALESHHHEVVSILLRWIPELTEYNRFQCIPCSLGDQQAWLNEDFDAELDTVEVDRRHGNTEEDGPSQFLQAQILDYFGQDIQRTYEKHMLGGHFPQGKEYLSKLLAARGTRAEFAALLDRGLGINEHGHPSAIEIAAKVGNIDVVKLLLERGADLRGALQAAVWCNQQQVIRLIFEERPDTDPDNFPPKRLGRTRSHVVLDFEHRSALAMAIEDGKNEVAQLLMTQKSTLPHLGPGPGLLEAVRRRNEHWIEVLLSTTCRTKINSWSEDQISIILDSLRFAVDEDDQNLLQSILEGTDMLKYRRKDLFEAMATKAILTNRTAILEHFHDLAEKSEKEYLAGIILHTTYLEERTKLGGSLSRFVEPYIESAAFAEGIHRTFTSLLEKQHYQSAIMLLDNYPGQDFLRNDSGLLQSVIQSHKVNEFCPSSNTTILLQLLEVLIKNGAQVNGKDKESRTPIFYACNYGLQDVFTLLITAGADFRCESVITASGKVSATEMDDTISEFGTAKVSTPATQNVNMLELTLSRINVRPDRHESKERHLSWAFIIFRFLEAGLTCPVDHPGLHLLFESACNLGILESIEKLLDPQTWKHLSPASPLHGFLNESRGLHLAAKRGRKEAVAVLLRHNANTLIKLRDPLEQTQEGRDQEQTALQGVLSPYWGVGEAENLHEVCDLLAYHGVSKEDGETLLSFALERDDRDRARRLLDRGVHLSKIPNNTTLPALKLVLQHRYSGQVKFEGLQDNLLKRVRADIYPELIARFDILGNLEIPMPSISSLLKEFFYVWEFTDEEKVAVIHEFMQRCNHDVNALYPCSGCGNALSLLVDVYRHTWHSTEVLETLLCMGADVHCPGLPYPALTAVCRDDSHNKKEFAVRAARLLLENGANVHGVRREPVAAACNHSASDEFEVTPLMYAIAGGNLELVSLLIEHGADVNRGFIAPLSVALRMWQQEKGDHIKLLIAHGATTKDYDVRQECKLDPALHLDGLSYWSQRECFDCKMYKNEWGMRQMSEDEENIEEI